MYPVRMYSGGTEERRHEGVRCEQRSRPLPYSGHQRLLVGERSAARVVRDLLERRHGAEQQ